MSAVVEPTLARPARAPRIRIPLFKVLVFLMYVFLLAPLLIVVVISFSSNTYMSFPPEGFSLQWYLKLPAQATFMTGLQTSLITSSITTVVVILLGVPAALALHRYNVPGKAALASFFLSPLLVPSIVLALGLVLVLNPMQLTNTYFSIIVGHFSITFPYLIRTTLMTLETTDTSCEEAARVLGASSLEVLRHITLPIIAPGVIAGAAIAFIVSFDEAVISLFVAESGKPTLPVQVMRYVEQQSDGLVAALSVVLIVFSMLAVVIVERVVGLRKTLGA